MDPIGASLDGEGQVIVDDEQSSPGARVGGNQPGRLEEITRRRGLVPQLDQARAAILGIAQDIRLDLRGGVG